MFRTLSRHWPEYLIEAGLLGVFMLAACAFSVLLEHRDSPVNHAIPPLPRRVLMGLAMGTTAVAIVYSRFGKRSGAHINPAFTLAFWRLGKVAPWDAAFYVGSQFMGAVLGVALALALLGRFVSDPSVNYAATLPGVFGTGVAFAAELVMAFLMMTMVLHATNDKRVARYTGLFAGALVAAFITLDAPISGMSINPARTLGSALPAKLWGTLWLYFTAPSFGMLLASELYRRTRGRVRCAKLHHDNDEPCIFHCEYGQA